MHGTSGSTPTTVGQIFKIHFAVIGIKGLNEWGDHVKGFDNPVSVDAGGRQIIKTNMGCIRPFEVFALMTDVDEVIRKRRFPGSVALSTKETFSGRKEAPVTPGQPCPLRRIQPLAVISSLDVYEKSSNKIWEEVASVG